MPDEARRTGRLEQSRATSAQLLGTVAVMLDVGGDLDIHCTGTLIAPDVVVTAAHCVLDVDDDNRIHGQIDPEDLIVVAPSSHRRRRRHGRRVRRGRL